MSVFGSMYTGVSGLNAQSQKLATISENIANVNTVGYKRIDTKFSTFVTQSTPTRHSPGGVLSTPYHNVDAQGLLQSTLNTTDMAVSGDGFFIVNERPIPQIGDEYLYTRAGSFTANANGDLVNTGGYYLQGWPLNQDGELPTDNGSLISLSTINVAKITGRPKATSEVDVGLNLPASAPKDLLGAGTDPDAIRTTDLVVFDSLGVGQTVRLKWTHVANNVWHMTANPGTGSVVDVRNATGAAINTANGATAGANTLNNSTIAGNYNYLIAEFNTDGTLKEIRDPSLVAAGITPATVYNNTTQTLDVTFDFSGTGADAAQTISFNFGRFNNTAAAHVADGTTQYDADYFTSFVNQNGVRYGSYTGININKEGVVTAIFDNGQTQPLYKVPLVTFNNPNGLEPRTGNAYTQTQEAGEFILREAGQGGTGTLNASSLEQSTVDIAAEFADMIVTQRAYSANTKIISTANEMIQDLLRVTG